MTSALSDQNVPSLSSAIGDDRLRIGKPDAGRDATPAGARAEVESGDVRLRVLLVEDVDALDVVGSRHRALDRHGQRHGIAVFDERRQCRA